MGRHQACPLNAAHHTCAVLTAPLLNPTTAAPEAGQDLMHKRQRVEGIIQGFECLDLLHAADGVIDAGPLALDDVKLNAQGRQGGQDVAEEDDAIRLECTPRLQDGSHASQHST